MLEKTLESPLDSKEIKPVNPKGHPPGIFTGRTDAEIEAPLPWPTKVHLVKGMVFPVVMYGCESWTVKKAERRRTELWCSVSVFTDVGGGHSDDEKWWC